MADAVIALTPEEVAYLTGPHGLPISKITTIPVGVNPTRFSPQGPTFPRTSRLRLVTVGRLVARKGVNTVIKAFSRPTEEFDTELLIAGGPSLDRIPSDPTIRRLSALTRELAVEERVTFLGRVPHDRVPELLRSADIFVCAPHYEPFGTAALEAAACGLPVIAPKVGGLQEHVLHETTGLLTPPADPDALAAALADLLRTPHRRSTMGTAGTVNARRFAWPRIADEILTAYRTTLKPTGTNVKSQFRNGRQGR